jgi:hypothetical protein
MVDHQFLTSKFLMAASELTAHVVLVLVVVGHPQIQIVRGTYFLLAIDAAAIGGGIGYEGKSVVDSIEVSGGLFCLR